MRFIDPSMLDFMVYARSMWRQNSGEVDKTTQTEDRKFRETFGCGLLVAFSVWNILLKSDVIPDGGTILHFLWTLMFLKVYATEKIMTSMAGNVDEKTYRK